MKKTVKGMVSQKIADSFRPVAMGEQIKPHYQKIRGKFFDRVSDLTGNVKSPKETVHPAPVRSPAS